MTEFTKALEAEADLEAGPASVSVTCSHAVDAESGLVDVLVSAFIPDTAERTPSDICCVIDISWSMTMEAKVQGADGQVESNGFSMLDLAKHSVRSVIHTLGPKDRLSIVTFCHTATTVLPLTVMDEAGREKADKELKAVGFGNGHHTLTSRTLEAIRRADEEGLRIVIATGRPAIALQPFVDQLGLPRPVPAVCFNGACALFLPAGKPARAAVKAESDDQASEVAEVHERRVVFSDPLSVEATELVLALCRELDWCPSYVRALGSSAAPRHAEHEQSLQHFESLEGVKQERVPDFAALLAAGDLPLKVVAMAKDPDAYAEQARAALPTGLVNIVAAEMHVEFVSPKVNKGLALARLCSQELDVSLEDVVAFGDNHNDKEMLGLVGEGVAMANAKDAVKQAADRTCAWTNDEEGVARELEALLAVPAAAQA